MLTCQMSEVGFSVVWMQWQIYGNEWRVAYDNHVFCVCSVRWSSFCVYSKQVKRNKTM